MSSRQKITKEALIIFALAGLAFGLLYNTLFYPRTLVEYLEAGSIGLVLGLTACWVETRFLSRRLRRGSVAGNLLLRTALYSTAVALILSIVLAIEPFMEGECGYGACLVATVTGPQFVRDLVFSTVFSFLTLLSAEIVLLIGPRDFLRLVLGRYQTPREMFAVFLFVDLRDSTPIAERLGHRRFSEFLREFLNDLTEAVHDNKGEIYQFVGDEVVVVWPGTRGAQRGLWLDSFLAMRDGIAAKKKEYLKRFGCVPQFKAAAHCGEVVLTEVGTVKRGHVYHGDTLNTTARIQGLCNSVGFDLLTSEQLHSLLASDRQREFHELGASELKGKEEEVVLMAHTNSVPANAA